MQKRFSVEKFLSHSAKKIRRGTLLHFKKLLVSKTLWIRGGGGYHAFPPKIQIFQICCFTVPKNFVGEHFCVSENFVWKNFMDKRGEGGSIVSENFWYGKILWIRGGREGVSRFSVETFLPYSTGEFRRRFLLCFRKFLAWKNFMDKRGEGGSITIFRRNFFASQYWRIS